MNVFLFPSYSASGADVARAAGSASVLSAELSPLLKFCPALAEMF